MDKEKCIFNQNGRCNIYAWSCDYADSCKGNPDCIIKRLQAENEELKNQYSFSTILKIDKLKAENERLKEEKGGMQILIDNYIALTEKYRQALQEIQKIADTEIDKMVKDDTFINVFGAIRNKIDEVIGAE